MITLSNKHIKLKGFVQVQRVSNFSPQIAPSFIWLDGICARVSALLSSEFEKNLQQLVEINNGCQILIDYDNEIHSKDIINNKFYCTATFIIAESTSEKANNSDLWRRFKKDSLYVEYPYVYLYHHTEEDKYPLIINSGQLNSSGWNLAGTEKLNITFSNLTDIKEIRHTFDLIPLAMKNTDGGFDLKFQDDYGATISANIYVTDRILSRSLKFKVDAGLIMPCHLIFHRQDTGEWWEYFFHNIYRICSSSIKLREFDDYYLVNIDQVENYKPAEGFILASGEDTSLIQLLVYERNISDFFY